MKDRVASGAPLHYLSALAPRGLGAGAGAGTARGSWERAAAGLALAASAARRARRRSISSSSRDGTDGDAADEPHVSAGDVSGEGGGGAAAAADAEWDDDALAPADADYDADADAGPDDDDEDGDPERSEWALPAPPPASTPFAAASTATDAAVQETRALARPVEVLSRAGRLLARPPLPTTFADEEDMRRVLALVYDVFRYKAVLSEVLSETRFFSDNHQLRGQESRVWLLLLDLIGRRFTARAATAAGAALLEAAGLRAADDALWQRRVALAAAVARARVRCGALRMSQLLPPLLRDERERAATHAHAYAPATPRAAASRTAAMLHQQTPRHRLTAWLNPFAIGEADPAMVLLSEAGLLLRDAAWAAERPRSRLLLERGAPHASHAGTLVHAPCCLHDCACPLLVAYHGPGDASGAGAGAGAGGALAASAAVKRGALVPLERARCRGAAALVGAVRALGLAGGVAQTHLLCPRSTAYLAALLVDVPGAGPLVVFGAGDRKAEAEAQLRALGVPAERVRVWAEPWLQAPVDALEGVCCALVSPPGALAALRDPVALALARGGDVQLLEEAADAAMAAAQTRAEEEADAEAGGGGAGGSRETRPPFVTPPASPEEQRERRARTAQAHDEQRAALRMAMAQPQIQVVAFETHTLDAGESQDLVTRLVTEANTTARQKRAEMAFLIGRAHAATPGATPAHVHPHSHPHPAADERQAQTPAPAVVDPEAPPCDLFELAPLAEGLSPAADEGCFVALLRRKVVSQGGVAGAAAGPNATKASSSDASSDDAEGGGGSDAAGDAGAPGRKSAQAARKRVRALVRARVRSRRSGTSAASGASSPGRRPAPTPAPDATARPRSRAYARDVASHLAQRRNKHQQQVERIAAPTVASLQRQRGPGAEGAVGGGGSGPSAAGPGPGSAGGLSCKRSRALAEDAEARKVRSGWGAGPGSRGRSPPRCLMRLPVARLPPPHCLAVRCPALRVSPRLLRALAALRARRDLHLTLQRLALARLVA